MILVRVDPLVSDCVLSGRTGGGGGGAGGGGGGGGSNKAQMRCCIRTLRSITSVADPSVNQDLCDQGAISQLLGNCRSTR